jgi:hypothetical protein
VGVYKWIKDNDNAEVTVHTKAALLTLCLLVLDFTYWAKKTEGVEFCPSRSISGRELCQLSICAY